MAVDAGRRRLVVAEPASATPARRRARRCWAAAWPKLLAVALFIGIWQVVVWSGWKPEYILPSPFTVLDQLLFHDLGTFRGRRCRDDATRRRGLRDRDRDRRGRGHRRRAGHVLRAAVGSMITGLQTMPSVAWVPLADRALPAERESHPVRRRARRRTFDRERHHRRHRPRPADAAARRTRARRARVLRAPSRGRCRPRSRRSWSA